MANLIITIISIALVAVAAIMGAYYGGRAFSDGQAKARANSILNEFKQIEAANNLWIINNGGRVPNPSSSYPVAAGNNTYYTPAELKTFLTSTYISSAPIDALHIYFQASYLENPILRANDLSNNKLTESTCRALEGIRTGTMSANQRNESWAGGTVNDIYCGWIGCFYDDPGGITYTGDYVAYMRIGGTPDKDATDCN